MAAHTPRATGPGRTALLAPVDSVEQAGRALADGADLIDTGGCTPSVASAIRARYPDAARRADTREAATLPGPGALVDADRIAVASGPPGAGEPAEASDAAVAAVAAISTWLGAAVVRTRHVRQARRAIDMTSSIAGTRPPSLTTRGLA